MCPKPGYIKLRKIASHGSLLRVRSLSKSSVLLFLVILNASIDAYIEKIKKLNKPSKIEKVTGVRIESQVYKPNT